jgi:hypothetical protein
MKSPNTKMIVPEDMGPDDEDQELRALISVDLDEADAVPFEAVDEFSDEFLMQVPKPPRVDE